MCICVCRIGKFINVRISAKVQKDQYMHNNQNSKTKIGKKKVKVARKKVSTLHIACSDSKVKSMSRVMYACNPKWVSTQGLEKFKDMLGHRKPCLKTTASKLKWGEESISV